MATATIGVIGGSGLYQMEGLTVLEERFVETPFGPPSDAIIIGELSSKKIAFLPRHGRGHVISPSEINFRANIFALKTLGVEQIFSVSAVGSMKESIAPGDIVLVDQFIDRTVQRPSTFFGNGLVAHVSFADPTCLRLLEITHKAAQKLKQKVHKGGTYVCIEGPMFSSRAESNLYRSWGVDVIGMTNYQEAKLSREAEICYLTIAMSTDYDCWNEAEGDVDVAKVIETLNKNVAAAKNLIREVLKDLSEKRGCACVSALEKGIITDRAKIPAEMKKRLQPIVGKYL